MGIWAKTKKELEAQTNQGFAKSALPLPDPCWPLAGPPRSSSVPLPREGPDQGLLPSGTPDYSREPSSEFLECWYPHRVQLGSLLTLLFNAPPAYLERVRTRMRRCMRTHSCLTYPVRQWMPYFLMLHCLAESCQCRLGDDGDQARPGAPTLTHCVILGELVPFLASFPACKIRKVDPMFCKSPPGHVIHLNIASAR